jgi:hypothetical protein
MGANYLLGAFFIGYALWLALRFERSLDDLFAYFQRGNQERFPDNRGPWRPWKKGFPTTRGETKIVLIVGILAFLTGAAACLLPVLT